MAICSAAATAPVTQSAAEDCRRQYGPSVWGDFFISYEPCTPEELLSMQEKARALKEEVRRIVLAAAAAAAASDDHDLVRKLELVDALQRLGVDYHFKKEIDVLLLAVYGDEDGGSNDLYVASLRFYLLRKHGYIVSSDVFLKFRDEQGHISSDDVGTLTTLYDAAHMRVHGEDILDNIIAFNKSRLQSLLMKANLDPALLEEVRVTLETTRFRRVERVEARRFISVYEKKAVRDDTILEFAKLDYNIVQVVYCNELKELTIWWKDLRSRVDLTFSRDRLVEMHFWMMGIVYEPHYSYARIMLTKQVLFMALLDDIYDNYSSTEESNIFTSALERWDEKAAEQIPEYLRPFFTNVIRCTDKVTGELKLQNNKHAEVVKEMREQASDHMASTVQTCMKQYGVTVEEAIEKLKEILERAWMDMVQECLDQKYPMALLEKVVSFAQSIDFFYKSEDLYTLPCNLKETLTSMYAKFV